MRRLHTALATALALATSSAAHAQDLAVYGGIALTSNYMFRGATQTADGPALQGYVEFDASGFYAGVWMSSVDFGDANSFETDLYLGYRGETGGGLSYDIVYARYFYDADGDCCGDLALSLGVPVSDKLTLTPDVWLVVEDGAAGYGLAVDYAINDQLALDADINHTTDDDSYGSVGLVFSASDTVSFDLRYHDSSFDSGRATFGVAFDTTLFSR